MISLNCRTSYPSTCTLEHLEQTSLFCLHVWMTFHPWSCCPQIKVTVFLERKIKYIVRVAWWIIFLTVVALLLMLAILVFFMWKVNQNLFVSDNRWDFYAEDWWMMLRLARVSQYSSFIWLFLCHFLSAWMHQLPGSAQEAPARSQWNCRDHSSDRRTLLNLPRT